MRYEIFPESARRFAFIPDDLRYFHNRFVCEPMAHTWEIPPAKPEGKSYKAADFVSWMLCAPVISTRAKHALEGVFAGLVEFLPFHAIRGDPYFAVNVLNTDPQAPIHKPDPQSVPLVDESVGAIIRDCKLSGVALADPQKDIMRRVVRGESLQDFPGLVG